MPRVQAKVEEIFGSEPDRGVNPDEIVAIGAAVQAGVIKGETENVLLLDVTPLSLGVETQGGVMTKIIGRNTTIPTRKSEVFSTTEDNQNLVRVHVLQGEREMAEHNQSLACFELVGIPPAPRGVPQIQVVFDINADGILDVSAKDLGTGQEQQVRVTASGGLTQETVDQLVEEAELHAEEDAERRGEGLVYSVKQTLEGYGEQLADSERDEVQEGLERARAALEGKNFDELRDSVEELQQLAYNMTEVIYERAGMGGDGSDDELVE
jgi:molecular chaperone DnaK